MATYRAIEQAKKQAENSATGRMWKKAIAIHNKTGGSMKKLVALAKSKK